MLDLLALCWMVRSQVDRSLWIFAVIVVRDLTMSACSLVNAVFFITARVFAFTFIVEFLHIEEVSVLFTVLYTLRDILLRFAKHHQANDDSEVEDSQSSIRDYSYVVDAVSLNEAASHAELPRIS